MNSTIKTTGVMTLTIIALIGLSACSKTPEAMCSELNANNIVAAEKSNLRLSKGIGEECKGWSPEKVKKVYEQMVPGEFTNF